ncbi:MAG: hypothetical protein CSA05_00905 [Bacteroidia bacterium]|nr:MAG: hypothetical protein CSA05_00905 [Bacteroidia bacterium]
MTVITCLICNFIIKNFSAKYKKCDYYANIMPKVFHFCVSDKKNEHKYLQVSFFYLPLVNILYICASSFLEYETKIQKNT